MLANALVDSAVRESACEPWRSVARAVKVVGGCRGCLKQRRAPPNPAAQTPLPGLTE
jgi:hypothetical protein